jgi:murein tripeptide amidase MpaA
MRISSNFDSGNIECLDCSQPADIRLAINKDRNSDFYQWFHFRLVGARGQDCTLRIMNAGGAAYPKGWEGYRAVHPDLATGSVWRRPRRAGSDDQPPAECRLVYYACFAPYRWSATRGSWPRRSPTRGCGSTCRASRSTGRIWTSACGRCRRRQAVIGIIARQHPGETMAEWWMEDSSNASWTPQTRCRRSCCAPVFHIVPNMNPDGSRRAISAPMPPA